MDALPPTPTVTIVERASDHIPLILMGIMAVGGDREMAALERTAKRRGLPTGRTKNDRDEPEVTVMFPPGTPREIAIGIFREASTGAFGKLRLEVTVISRAAAADGIDYDTEVTIEDPTYIVAPNG